MIKRVNTISKLADELGEKKILFRLRIGVYSWMV